jgi:hypothetical protein
MATRKDIFGRFEEVTLGSPPVTFKVPVTAAAWQLYDEEPGAEIAAARLTEALKAAFLAPYDEACKIMSDALKKDSDFGAYDTEPRQLAEDILTKNRQEDFGWAL